MTEPAVVLDASTSMGRVDAKLSLYPRNTWFVVRDDRTAQVRWYVLDGWDLLDEIAGADGELSLGEAIDLEPYRAAAHRASDRKDSLSASPADAVILDGTEVLGVVAKREHGVIPGLYRDWLPTLRAGDSDPLRPERWFAWPSIVAPSRAMPGEEVVLTVVLSQQYQDSAPIHVSLLPEEGEFDLEIDVAAIGFDAPKGWRHALHVSVATSRHSVEIPLLVRNDAQAGRALVHIAFLKDGVVCGNATWVIAIGLAAADPIPGESSPCILPEIDDRPADLLVTIRKADGNSATGRYVWTMNSTIVPIEPQPFPVDLGDDARTFARSLMRDVMEADGTALLEPVLKAIGQEIAAHVPPAFWEALHLVAAAVATENRCPSVLLYSAEEFVPWELASMEQPLTDGPPYLAAQVTVGRWLHSQSGIVPLRPPSSISRRDIAVLAPDYRTRGQARLERALEEASHMTQAYGAIAVNATEDDVRRLLDAEIAHADGSPADIGVVHYAGHGSSDPTRPGSAGLFLVNGKRLSPRVFAATMLGNRFGPLLFINACEAGMAQRILEDNAGFAAISLRGGFRGFIAPLWGVDDEAAADVARRFYNMTLGDDPQEVGTVLREIRRSHRSNRDATLLSYVYYGHPRLSLRQKRPA